MEQRVFVLLPNGHRHKVPVSPNTTLLQVLEAACEHHGCESDTYGLKFHNKALDLNKMFRFSGLPNNCVINMEQTEQKRQTDSKVLVCVQLADNTRQQGEFVPTSDLWTVAQSLHGDVLSNYESPVVIFMRAEVVGEEKLRSTTLKSLGANSGGVMLRLMNKTADELKTQANVYKPATVKHKPVEEQLGRPKPAGAAGCSAAVGFALNSNVLKSLKRPAVDAEPSGSGTQSTDSVSPSGVVAPEQPEKPKYDWGTGVGYSIKPDAAAQMNAEAMDESIDAEADMPKVNIIGPREAVLISLDQCRQVDTDLPDSFFELTVSDLRLILRDLAKIAKGTSDEPMRTSEQRDAEQKDALLRKLKDYKDCVIRVRFPDRHVLQAIFKPDERIATVEDFIRNFIVRPEEPFELFITPPKRQLAADKTLLELDLLPNALVHFAYINTDYNDRDDQFVKTEYLDKLTSDEGASYAIKRHRVQSLET